MCLQNCHMDDVAGGLIEIAVASWHGQEDVQAKQVVAM